MTVFWIVAALFLAGALLMLLPALLSRRHGDTPAADTAGANLAVYRDQLAEAERDLAAGLISADWLAQARQEIQRRVLEDTRADASVSQRPARGTALVLAVLIPLFSVLTYLQVGRPEAVAPQVRAAVPGAGTGAGAGAGAGHSVTPEQIQQMVAALAERLKARPDDIEGWLMLGRSYTALQRYGDAAIAVRKAVALNPRDAGLLADLADVTGMAQGKRLAGQPARLIQQALDIDPRHVKALSLAGSVAFEARDYAAARAYWMRLVAVVPAGSPIARSVQNSIAEATQLEAGGAASVTPVKPVTSVVAAGAAPAASATQHDTAITGQVVISPALVARLAPGDTLFVFARAAQGPRIPLAIMRRPADAAPTDFRLDDSQAMAPNLRLSGAAQVIVGARISRSGNATPQPGDLIGQSAPVAPGTGGLRITIDRVQAAGPAGAGAGPAPTP